MQNISNELLSVYYSISSQLVVTDVTTDKFKILMSQLSDVLTAMQFLDHDETLHNIMFDTTSNEIRGLLFTHLDEIE